ncbi:MAG TPA: DNA polymerase I [Vicinamibacterales bacterium]|nr:DNA polymerase I [Vicinamibacterales bacterium]
MARPRLFLIDGSSQMYRAYHAMRGGGLSNQEGSTTHAVYLFVTMLRKLMADHSPAYIAASFDLRGKTFRDEIVSDYKANRAAMPDDLAEQIGWVHEACEAMGVPILTSPGYEADDVIGTLAVKAVGGGYDVAIVSIDKDFFQLVADPHVKVYDPREEGTWFDEAGVVHKFGVPPSQVVDVLALVGDTSDNVAGVPGIGKKGAIDLMTRFGSLDALLDGAASQLKGKQRDTLVEHRADALQSRELVTIRTDVPLDVDLATLAYRGASREKCYELFTRLAFRTLVNDYAPTMESTPHEYELVTTAAAFEALVGRLTAAGQFGIRIVTDDIAAVRAPIVGFTFTVADRQAAYVPVGHESGDGGGDLLSAASRPEQLELPPVVSRLKPLLEDPAVRKLGHDLKQETILLARHGVTLRGVEFDAMLGSYLLDANRSSHGLPEIALEHLGYRAIDQESVAGKGVRAVPLSQLSPEAALKLACERVDVARQLSRKLAPMLETEQLAAVNRDLELPLVDVLADIERAGIRVDTDALARQGVQLENQLLALTGRIHELAGGEFNISSPKQLGEVLFERLNLPVIKKTGGTRSASTAVEVLEELALTHELPKLILEFRGLHKLKGTYVDALPLLVNPETGRVHTSFNQAVAATGRLSSSDPNLQNIPIRTEIGRHIRSAFIAAPGHVLISADYSQIELRVLAHLAGEDVLIESFRVGEDIHDRTALKVFGADSGLSKHELRRRAKIINYALLYGKTAFTLAKDIGVTKEAAQTFIDAYFAGFPKVRGYIDATVEEARRTGVVKTMFGRRRLVPELNSRNGQIRMAAERATINMPIQGTAADVLKRAMIDIHTALAHSAGTSGPRTRMILTVHDELVFESPKEQAEEASAMVKELMQNAVKLAVPLDVDVGYADNWRDAKS